MQCQRERIYEIFKFNYIEDLTLNGCHSSWVSFVGLASHKLGSWASKFTLSSWRGKNEKTHKSSQKQKKIHHSWPRVMSKILLVVCCLQSGLSLLLSWPEDRRQSFNKEPSQHSLPLPGELAGGQGQTGDVLLAAHICPVDRREPAPQTGLKAPGFHQSYRHLHSPGLERL